MSSKKKKVERPARAAAHHAPPAHGPEQAVPSASLRFGWAMVVVFLAMGLLLEIFHLVKLPSYVDVRLRRELWTLAHAHGTLLGALNVLFGLSAGRLIAQAGRRLLAGKLLGAGSLLVPAGFFLGGLWAAEGDPALFIVLVPVGALLALTGLTMLLRR